MRPELLQTSSHTESPDRRKSLAEGRLLAAPMLRECFHSFQRIATIRVRRLGHPVAAEGNLGHAGTRQVASAEGQSPGPAPFVVDGVGG